MRVTSSIFGDLDRRILHGVQVHPRVPLATLGGVLGVSEQTAARRYRRLVDAGVVRVVGIASYDGPRWPSWFVRLRCRPGHTTALADALAARPDVGWVAITAGGSEIECRVGAPAGGSGGSELLLAQLPRTVQISSITASSILHRFVGTTPDWTAYSPGLTEAQLAALAPPPPVTSRAAEPVSAADGPLLAELARDGRASYRVLAEAAGWTPGRAARRVAELVASGELTIDVDLAARQLGYGTEARLWLTVPPSHLAAVGATLATFPEVPFVAAVTGPATLLAAVLCHDDEELYRVVVDRVGSLEGVSNAEVTTVLRRVKQAGAVVRDGRLTTSVPAG